METDSSPVLVSDASLPNQTLWFGRAELYDTYIRIIGWRWNGRYEQRIRLEDLERVETWSHTDGPNLVLFTDESDHPLRLDTGVMLWHWKLKDRNVDVKGRG